MNYKEFKARIVNSGIFDIKHYLSTYPDVSIVISSNFGVDPLDHYIRIGSFLGRLPHKALSPEDLPPVSWETPLEDHPMARLIDENGLVFDPHWYLDRYKDVARAGVDPVAHYQKSGRFERRSPNHKAELLTDLDTAWYARAYRSQISGNVTPLQHYLASGADQGNRPNNEPSKASNFLFRFGASEYVSKFDFIIEADTITPLVEGFDLSIAVHMHIFYDSLLEEMATYVSHISAPYDVFISIPEGRYAADDIAQRAHSYLKGCRRVTVREFPNVGRDIAPMLAGFGPDLLKYDLLLHMHSKRSPHNPSLSSWRRYLLHHNCGNKNITNQILNHFVTSPSAGSCFPPYYPNLRKMPNWGQNIEIVRELCDRLGVLQVDPEKVPDFPAGSFFWVRSKAIAPLLDNAFTFDDFDAEKGQVDQTIAHGIERILGHLPLALGYVNSMPFVDVGYNLQNYFPSDRPSPKWEPKRINIDEIVAARAARPKNRTAMVTAITGGFDPLIIHESLSDDIDYICFSNEPLPDGYGLYDVRVAPYDHPDVRRIARFVKTNLVHLLAEYDTIIWVDGNLQLTAPIDGLIARMKEQNLSIAAIPHPVHSNVHEESRLLIQAKLDDPEVICAQMEKYDRIDPGLARERLIESNFMIFDTTDPRVAKVTDLWWAEINSHSKRDQLSLNYALRTHGVEWMPIFDEQLSMRDSSLSRMFSHGAGPRYARTDDGWLRVIGADARKGQEIGLAEIPRVDDFDTLKNAADDAWVEIEQILEHPDSAVLQSLDALGSSENPEDMEVEHLSNGVSLQNWVPRRWVQTNWSASVGISKVNDAACFGGTIVKTFIDGHEKGHMVLSGTGALCDASFGVWNGERLLSKDLLTPMEQDRWRLEAGVSARTFQGDHYLLGSLQPHFGHALLEGLSRVWALFEYPDLFGQMPLLVFEPRLYEYHSQFLKLAEISETRIVHAPTTGVTVERLWIPDPAIRSHRWISTRQGIVWRRISDAISTAKPSRKIYLSRTCILERPLVNEAEVEDILKRQGFEIIHPETLPLDEQIRTVAEATHIVGPVGSQMYLAAFQKPGTRKTILAPSNFYAKDDSMISKAIGNSCEVIFGEKVDNFADRVERRWSIGIDALRRQFAGVS